MTFVCVCSESVFADALIRAEMYEMFGSDNNDNNHEDIDAFTRAQMYEMFGSDDEDDSFDAWDHGENA